MDIQGIGHYYGTELDGIWWKRFLKMGFFARGLGQYWLDQSGFNFRRYLLPHQLQIPFRSIAGVRLGKWHAGKWAAGRPVLKIEWHEGEQRMISGFTIMGHQENLSPLMDAIASSLKQDR